MAHPELIRIHIVNPLSITFKTSNPRDFEDSCSVCTIMKVKVLSEGGRVGNIIYCCTHDWQQP